MKKTVIPAVAAALFLVVAGAATAQAGVDVSVNIGIPVSAPVVAAPYPQGSPWPVMQPEVYFDEAPSFIYAPRLGFHVSVGLPYDIVYLNNGYYLYRGGNWYLSPTYSGPWNLVSSRRLPQALHKYRYEEICHHRDHEYRTYKRDRDHYRGNWHRPVHVKKVVRYVEKDRHDHGWSGRDQAREHRRDARQHEREHRREHRDDNRDWRDRR